MKEVRKALRRDILKIEKNIDEFLERIVDSASAIVITAYERKITKLEHEKLLTVEKLAKSTESKGTFKQMLELSMLFLENPWKLWASGDINLQKTVLRLAFSEHLPYHRNEGYRTPKTTLPFNILRQIDDCKNQMVPHG